MHTMIQNDRDLLREFEVLLIPAMDGLYRLALKLTRHPVDAEDLVQDACLNAYCGFKSFELGSNFKRWISKILINRFITLYNKKKRQPQRVDFDKVIPTFVPETQNFKSGVNVIHHYGRLFDDKITSAIETLPDHYKHVLLLSDVGDYKYKEIAELLECPVGTVMSRLSRARRTLARMLRWYARQQGYVRDMGQR